MSVTMLNNPKLTEEIIKTLFGNQTYLKGLEYKKMGRVLNLSVSENKNHITANVKGAQANIYQVDITIEPDNNLFFRIDINGDCTCPMLYNCKHVAAVLIAASEIADKSYSISKSNTNQKTSNGTSPETFIKPSLSGQTFIQEITKSNVSTTNVSQFNAWFKNLENNIIHSHDINNPPNIANTNANAVKSANNANCLLYILEYKQREEITIKLMIAKQLKKGGYGSTRLFSTSSDAHHRALREVDHDILHRLEVHKRTQDAFSRYHHSMYSGEYDLNSDMGGKILSDIIKTNRLCYDSLKPKLITLGTNKIGAFEWQIEESGKQHLVCTSDNKKMIVLPLTPLWYLDLETFSCGILEVSLSPPLVKTLLTAPKVLPEQIETIEKKYKKHFSSLSIPTPHHLETVHIDSEKPSVHLKLFGVEYYYPHLYRKHSKDFNSDGCFPLGRISFVYDNTVAAALNSPDIIYKAETKKGIIKAIKRDLAFEGKCIDELLQYGVDLFSKRFPRISTKEINSYDFLIADPNNMDAQSRFVYEVVPKLQRQGWKVTIDTTFPVEYIASIDDWYTDIQEESGIDWFQMELGFVVDGQKINILPFLIKLIQETPKAFSEEALKELREDASFGITLPNGQSFLIPTERVRGILSVLTELYDSTSLTKEGFLRLPRQRASDIAGLDKIMQTTQMRWMGFDRLRELAEKLRDFKGIQSTCIPASFKGELRDYQKTGVDWLSFLREYQLGGILCDDMGLGKTIQTLAYLAIEKQNNRLNAPCLIIAPTSLMGNWYNEANRFVNTLKVLILQGQFRKSLIEEMNSADIILTTYPLLIRDQDVLLQHSYSTIILDEAQFAKNTNTKSYHVLLQLRAEHRLCLTGTPMENHLGELWSLFNFLSPGLLGTSKQFTHIFRTPIEKQGNAERRTILNQRIRPYLLRRTKESVLQELPPKTEMIHNIILEDQQRDLYESIRLSMDKKIKQTIENKGLASSQIIILDALLKLRQTCCHPPLLNLEQGKKINKSAKFLFLMNMLSELIEEGRKILVFSSLPSVFTFIETELLNLNISYQKLTGETVDRKTPIDEFQNGKVPLFLISLKAGGTGLNLTAADTVIHYDPWWNPAAEAQATDRAYRIGQTKPVFVYKLITTGTVEEKILLLQQKKRALLDSIFSEQQNAKTTASFSLEDINYLFEPIDKVKDH